MAARRTLPKLDIYRLHRADYEAPRTPKLVRIPPAKYLALSGSGRPGDRRFQSAIGALYGMAYTIKFQRKAVGQDFKVPMLEGIYEARGGLWDHAPDQPLDWRLLLRMPDDLSRPGLRTAAVGLADRGKEGPFRDVGLASLREGTCVQMLHIGPYSAERPTIERMARYATDLGWTMRGPHHEIYLSDPGRTPEARLRTILRSPVRR
jgi:hypothetical protein